MSVRSIKSDFSGDAGRGDINNLINGYNITTSESNMYLLPFQPGRSITLTLTFEIP